MQDHDLASRDDRNRIDLDDVTLGGGDALLDHHLVGLLHDVQHDRHPDPDEDCVLEGHEHGEHEGDASTARCTRPAFHTDGCRLA